MDHGGDIYRAMEELSLKNEELLDFSANINPLGPPKGVFEEIQSQLKMLIHYPEPYARALRERLAEKLSIEKDEVLMANGAVELILPLFRKLKKKYKRALLIQPTFNEYEKALKVLGMEIERLFLKEERGFALCLSALMDVWRRGDLIILCNPNNPTGNLIGRGTLEEILGSLEERESFLFVDEAFMDFVSPSQSLIAPQKRLEQLFVLRSLTKFYSLPGLRMGYGVGSRELVREVGEEISLWSMNHLAQRAALVAIEDEDFAFNTLQWIEEERKYLIKGLKGLPLTIFPSSANFLLLKLKGASMRAPCLREKLLKEGILIRDCAQFSGLGSRFFRVAIKGREENRALVDQLKAIF